MSGGVPPSPPLLPHPSTTTTTRHLLSQPRRQFCGEHGHGMAPLTQGQGIAGHAPDSGHGQE